MEGRMQMLKAIGEELLPRSGFALPASHICVSAEHQTPTAQGAHTLETQLLHPRPLVPSAPWAHRWGHKVAENIVNYTTEQFCAQAPSAVILFDLSTENSGALSGWSVCSFGDTIFQKALWRTLGPRVAKWCSVQVLLACSSTWPCSLVRT